jgi:hypothetical protein
MTAPKAMSEMKEKQVSHLLMNDQQILQIHTLQIPAGNPGQQ